MPIVEVRSLSYTYPGSTKPTLTNVNFSVEEGEFILLTGPSGCGKTTLCRCLNGLIPNSYGGEFNGQVIVDGLVTTEHPVYEIAQHVGLVFQNPENELFCTSVEREVAFGPENLALPREEIRKRVEESLAMVGISHLRDKSPEELSGGEQQKVAIAALLAMKPKILVLDEPTANLDPASAQSVLNVLLKLNEESGVTTILVEHRLEMVAHMAHRCAILNEGRLVLMGKPEDVLYSDEAEAIGIGIPKVVQVTKALGINKMTGKCPLTSWSLADLLRVRKK
ncbi:MAG: energy-coupling factor ABC transporter ATP-binding protein [Candidatus Methanomethylicia archaeon]|nr:energy-coupling factor ABC transporter ATP-binding protein [Candidatus Methanomethylicia archaeon]